jgi:hypothetical protein
MCALTLAHQKNKQLPPPESVSFVTFLAAATSPPTAKAEVAAFTTRSTA